MKEPRCFIHLNYPELRELLKIRGIMQNSLDENDINHPWLAVNHGMFISVSEGFGNIKGDGIDCGRNVDMFLAIASMCDYTDFKQLFICDAKDDCCIVHDIYFTSEFDNVYQHIDRYVNWNYVYNVRKATLKEIINHYWNEEENEFSNKETLLRYQEGSI